MEFIRVMIADDQPLIREGLKTVLGMEPGLTVVATAGNGAEACEAAEALKPDVLLLDIRMPGMDGIACIQSIKKLCPSTKVIMLTTFSDEEYIIDALACGASGYLLKDIEIPMLVEAIHDAAMGKMVLPPDVAAKLAEGLSRRQALSVSKTSAQLPELTGREREIAVMIAQGFTNRQISSALYIAEGTVRNTVSSIYMKIGIGDRTQAALHLKKCLL